MQGTGQASSVTGPGGGSLPTPAEVGTTPAIEATGIHKYFGPVAALRGVHLTANFGQVTCVLGSNGAGKSTLIKILCGLITPDNGTVRVQGKAVQLRSPRDAIELGIGTVHQDLGLVPLLNVARNFFLGQEITKGWGPWRRLDERRMLDVSVQRAAELGVHLRNPRQPVATLSGGQRQVVAIARALFWGAKILILDEPTAALGVAETQRVLHAIKLVRDSGRAVIVVTHNVMHALDIGDHFIGIKLGQVNGTLSRGCGKDELLDLMGG